MYLQKIQNIVIGYVNIEVEGYYIEKFINICRKNNVYLLNLKREKNILIRTDIPVRDFKRVVNFAKENKCRIKIKQKKGLPFLLNRYRKRKIFAISLLFVIIALISLSKFIWNIEITGNSNVTTSEILEIVKEEGLDIGKLKSKIDAQDIVDTIRLKRADISWVGIKISGTNAIIEIVEADAAPEIIDEDEYCNIVSMKDAMIVSASAQNGSLQVKEGDVVKKGSILIAGWLEGKYTGTRYVHATGDVIAKVWYSEKSRIYYKQNVKTKTGNTESKYSLNINNFGINFYKKLSKFEIYDTISTEKKLKISSNFYLPFKITEKINYEIIEEEKVYEKDEATQIAINEAKQKLKEKILNEEDIVNEYINTNESEEYI